MAMEPVVLNDTIGPIIEGIRSDIHGYNRGLFNGEELACGLVDLSRDLSGCVKGVIYGNFEDGIYRLYLSGTPSLNLLAIDVMIRDYNSRRISMKEFTREFARASYALYRSFCKNP